MAADSPPHEDDLQESGETVADSTMHAFNVTRDDTVIERGSDSGAPASCDSSIISSCSNLEDAYNLLVRRNTTLMEDNHSESSSSTSSSKKKTSTKERSRSKPPIPSRRTESCNKSGTKTPKKMTVPTSLDLSKKRPTSGKNAKTPTDDGRWPSINSKPAPLMAKSMKMNGEAPKLRQSDAKTIEKYATLPRRRKEKSNEDVKKTIKDEQSKVTATSVRKTVCNRDLTPSRAFNFQKKKQKVKIYHEISIQTVLTVSDVEKAFAGLTVAPMEPSDIEKCDKSEQIDISVKEMETLRNQYKNLKEKYDELQKEHKIQGEKLREEFVEKEGLKEELQKNSERVLAILGDCKDDENTSSDSLLVLESRYQNVSQVVINQEEEISKLNSYCRSLQKDLEKLQATQEHLIQQHTELEIESRELQEFLQAEKGTLAEALKESENEITQSRQLLTSKEKELQEKQEECKRRLHENWSLQARMGSLESKCRELLVQQGSSVSGTSVALSALIGRLEGLVDELIASYSISDQELDDCIFHNEAYNSQTPEKCRTPSPKKVSSFLSAVINAIAEAVAGNKSFKENSCEQSPSTELLDSETEPCLMMEHVLEDVVIPDGHSHNMVSSCHSMLSSHSDSFLDMSRSTDQPSFSELFPSLVDQVIDVDNLITRLLKVIRIIHIENEDCMNELQEQRDNLNEQVDKQKETSKLIGKQLKDWEILGSRLKTEVKELMLQLSKKNNEIETIKCELNKQREEVEKLNRDVCELSTALAKAELEMKMKEEEVTEGLKKIDEGEIPDREVMIRLRTSLDEVPLLKEKLSQKERHLSELTQEFFVSKQVLTESLKEAMNEAKKQYETIDNALEVLHNNQNIVQQCPPLAELQRQLENFNFESASAMPLLPPDCNANAALLQALATA